MEIVDIADVSSCSVCGVDKSFLELTNDEINVQFSKIEGPIPI